MKNSPPLDLLLECAVAAAKAAGRHALENRHRRMETLERFAHDVKLKLDMECQQRAEEVIRRAYPSHHILGEEGASDKPAGEWIWLVDPLDGTVNYMHGLPVWCSSVAVARGDDVLVGAVFIPEFDECYTATREGPAECNGAAIHVSAIRTLADALLLTGLSKHVESHPEVLRLAAALAARAQKVRVMGAAAVDICQVACGRADGYYEASIYLWDVAAAGLVAQRAGGRAEIIQRFSPLHLRYLCTNGHIHEELKTLVLTNPKGPG